MTWRPRLLPAAIIAMAGLFLVKAEALLTAVRAPALPVMAPARASEPAPAHAPSPAATPARPQAPPPPDPAALAERALLEQLRARRTELEAREQAVATQEMVLQATEQRLARRVEELAAMQRRIEALDRTHSEQEEAGWRGLVRTYETMRPRDAATIFNELEMPVLVEILDRMSERKAAPVIGAMRPERARMVTAELARHRARQTAAN